jgi:hypothetical protein
MLKNSSFYFLIVIAMYVFNAWIISSQHQNKKKHRQPTFPPQLCKSLIGLTTRYPKAVFRVLTFKANERTLIGIPMPVIKIEQLGV